MGNKISTQETKDNGVFASELSSVKSIVNRIIDEKDVFINKDYNFLSQDVCKQHYVLLQQELNQHLKVELEALGTSLYIIPRNNDDKLTKLGLSKAEICQQISNHYIKILYILCLIKYVFNLENNGDLSIAGIIYRNIKIMDNIMLIDFCQIPHKDYSRDGKNIYKIDFSNLEGMNFFSNYFLSPQESSVFVSLVRMILSRKKQSVVRAKVCSMLSNNNISKELLAELESLFMKRFNNKLVCTKEDISNKKHQETSNSNSNSSSSNTNANANVSSSSSTSSKGGSRRIDLTVFIEKDNPIFHSKLCLSSNQLMVQLDTSEGKKLHAMYKDMQASYNKSIKEIHTIIDKLVYKNGNDEYVLKDITKDVLHDIIEETKTKIKIFYLQSIIDYQNLLDFAKTMPDATLRKGN
jgi:hypothetical protein